MTETERLTHLEFIQAVITRHATRSFLIKGWCTTVAAAFFGFAVQKDEPRFALLGTAVAVAFYLLDAYYLRQERLFRCLWNAAVSDQPPAAFSMVTTPYCGNKGSRRRDVLRTGTLWGLYGALAAAGMIVALATQGQDDSACLTASAQPSAASSTAESGVAGQKDHTRSSCHRGRT